MIGKRKDTPKSASSKRYEHYKAILSQLSNETQNHIVLDYLMKHQFMTTFDAYDKFGITRLPSRVNDLRNMGIDIDCDIVYKGKKRFGKYSLVY